MEGDRTSWVSISNNSSITRNGLEWENLGFCNNSNNQNGENQQVVDLSTMAGGGGGGGGGGVWLEDEIGKLGSGFNYSYDDIMLRRVDSTSGEALTGLRLGRQHKPYGGGSGVGRLLSVSSSSSSSLPLCSVGSAMKRSRASFQNMQNPCCQVQGCNLDLKLAKDYHRRHRICEIHSKSPKVIVAGLERRFCQQCSRFHELSEFDDKKRSCRRRLSDHNARRRRVQPESISVNHGMPSSSPAASLYGNNNILLNGLPVSLSNAANHHHHQQQHYPLLAVQDQWGMGMGMGMDVITSAQSLLSTGPAWSLDGESMDGGSGLIMGNNRAAMPNKTATNEGEGDEGIPVHSITTTAESHLQEFHLFYDPAPI